MFIRYISDIHLDHYIRHNGVPWFPPPMPEDSETILILAGDLSSKNQFVKDVDPVSNQSWLGKVSSQFRHVIIVFGNHDYWGLNLVTAIQNARTLAENQNIKNISILDGESVIIDDVKFVGGTLWTDFDNSDPFSMDGARQYMNDYQYIKYSVDGSFYRKATPNDVLAEHYRQRKLIFDTKKDECRKLVCVTHMAPSYQSVHWQYRNQGSALSNTWYYTNLEQQVLDSEFDYYFHGHIHQVADYMIGDTNVICNPLGYSKYEGVIGNINARIDL